MHQKKHYDLLILGAGITGLSLGYFLKKETNLNFAILEKSDHTGGWIGSEVIDGYRFEKGPHTIRAKGSTNAIFSLIKQLSLNDELIYPKTKKRFLYTRGKMRTLPSLLLQNAAPLLKGAISSCFLSRKTDESVFSYFERRIGKNATELFIDSLITGIYAGESRKLSMRWCFPEKKKGSSTIFSLKNGLVSLIDALTDALTSFIHLNCPVLSYTCGEVKTESGTYTADHIVSTLPRNDISYASIAMGYVGFLHDVLPFKGFGYLIPPKEQKEVLGAIFDSALFLSPTEDKQTRLTFMMRDHPCDNVLQKRALTSLRTHLGIDKEPAMLAIRRAPNSIPQFPVGYTLPQSKGITYLGLSATGVSVSDCVEASFKFSMNKEWIKSR